MQSPNRQLQRWQLAEILDQVQSIPDTAPLIVGGDFNLPANDRLLRPLRHRLRDSFKESGTGLGNTIDNNFPFLRIDQIWIGKYFHPAVVIVRRTVHTDQDRGLYPCNLWNLWFL